jgi:hypothetical protein
MAKPLKKMIISGSNFLHRGDGETTRCDLPGLLARSDTHGWPCPICHEPTEAEHRNALSLSDRQVKALAQKPSAHNCGEVYITTEGRTALTAFAADA